MNSHYIKFKLVFEPEDDDYDGDETYFPSESDIEHAIDNSLLDQANTYHVYLKSSSDKKVVFIIEASNEDTDEYLPDESDIEHAMEYSGCIDEWNRFYADTIDKSISKAVYRERKLNQLGI